jgi:HlyD family type I secretion membrane fusion protein
MTVGWLSLLALVGVLGVWAMGSVIAGAVIAPGTIEVESNRQVVQHPDGGVVGEILAHDGDRVQAGDVLIRLDGSRTQSELAIVTGQLRDLAARQARLEAERDGRDMVTPPAYPGTLAGDADFAARLDSERSLFRARSEALAQETGLLREQSAQIENRIAGTEAQLDAARRQAELLTAALADQKSLLAEGLTQASRAMDTERELANAKGQIGQLTAQIADLRGQISANAIAMLQLQTRRREEAVTQLRDIQAKTYGLAEQELALRDTLSRLEIRAPVAGIVYGSRVFAMQSVVQRADPILYIIPQDQPLVVAARLDATHIDDVHLGQPVSLRFSAFDQRDAQPVEGRLTQISADVVVDEATQQTYYAVRIEPDAAALAALGDRVLVPGMPVEAFITTGDRSPMSYLLHPLMVYFDRAFRQ